MGTPKQRANLALGLYVIALCTPAISLGGDRLFGFNALALSFAGLFMFGLTWDSYFACMLGATANVLFAVSYIGVVARLESEWKAAYLVTAGTATALTILAICPLWSSGKLSEVSFGYALWAGSAAMLVSGAWPATASDQRHPAVSERKVRPEEFMQEGDSPDFFK